MEKNHVYQNNWFRQIFLLSFLLSTWPSPLQASERIHTAYFSPAPGASAVIWVAKEARLFDKHGLRRCSRTDSQQRTHASGDIGWRKRDCRERGPCGC